MKKLLPRRNGIGRSLLALLLAGFAASSSAQQPQAYPLTGDYPRTHDPSLAREGDTYYVCATGKTKTGGQFAVRCSTDLREWRICGQVSDTIPAWISGKARGQKTFGLRISRITRENTGSTMLIRYLERTISLSLGIFVAVV
jgi:hypothetical protein